MFATTKAFIRDESGATAIEYGLIAALVSVSAMFAIQGFGSSLVNMFTTVSSSVDPAVAGATP